MVFRLSPEDNKRLKKILGRHPEPIETVLALALWNEHCSYRSSKEHLKKLIFSTGKTVSALGEQAGIVDLGRGERLAFKMESHNHPSFIAPYHGSATAVGGILRDIFAMGARPVALADWLCFGESKTRGNAGRVDGVVRGIGDYGNCIGIPTLAGQTEFSSAYNGNILVNAMAIGYLRPGAKALSAKAQGPGNYVVYAGSSTGRDGILGADMASRSFQKKEREARLSVQIGDPFFGKQLMEASLSAMEKGLVLACQDMGAAGLTCSSFEMAGRGERGLKLHLEKVPLRDKSMTPEEILLSESQERMLFICEPSQWEELKNLFEAYDLKICVLGEVSDRKEIRLYWKGKKLVDLDPKIFTEKGPVENRPYCFPSPAKRALSVRLDLSPQDVKTLLLKILSSPEGRSRQFIYRQYDQRVGALTVKDASFPLGIIRLPESGRELGFALGCRPYLMDRDVEQGAKDAVFYPALQLALRGFEPWAVTDCLNFGNPENRQVMGDFVLSVESLANACKALDIPIVSGNVSFYNESRGKNITPSPAIGMIGLKECREGKIPPAGFQQGGESVYLLSSHQLYLPGRIKNFLNQKVGSKKESASFSGRSAIFFKPDMAPPLSAPSQEDVIYGALQNPLVCLFGQNIRKMSRLFSSARLVGKFGLAYALACMALRQKVGFALKSSFPLCLFQERLYEAVVSVESKKKEEFTAQAKTLGLDCIPLGRNPVGAGSSYTEGEDFLQGFKGELFSILGGYKLISSNDKHTGRGI